MIQGGIFEFSTNNSNKTRVEGCGVVRNKYEHKEEGELRQSDVTTTTEDNTTKQVERGVSKITVEWISQSLMKELPELGDLSHHRMTKKGACLNGEIIRGTNH